MTPYAIIRVQTAGPPALEGPPNVFDHRADAEARIAEIEAGHLTSHHTWLYILEFEGPLENVLDRQGIAF